MDLSAASWEQLDQLGLRHGRNRMPELLMNSWYDGLDLAERPGCVADAWTMAEFPESSLDADVWLEMFWEVGYTDNGTPVAPPHEVTLHRGGTRLGMAWTSDRDRAEWFRRRFSDDGQLWTMTVGGDNLLAHITARNEDEYVINPTAVDRMGDQDRPDDSLSEQRKRPQRPLD